MSGIMVQGTASSVGKSLISAALCRIFYKAGYKVCPFKSQNMSLNSYVTMEGLEMGRAQVLQAEAAGIEPAAYMNPILLKPTSDRKSQVIINGRPYKTMDAVEYFEFKTTLKSMIKETYRKIEKKFDFVVIEGAGSPAEINLKDNDIVNMGMAEIADASVILVADIDKGGVFAAIYGTVMLLEKSERERIKGIIINKFRGDKAILQNGVDMIEKLVNIPVVGIIPYMNVKLDEEDGASEIKSAVGGEVQISVIKLPRISNFTDFDAFKFDEDVTINFITSPIEIGDADMLIIPGSKNTIEDLRWLKASGFDVAIKTFKGIVFGICGGYQIMGSRIIDVEGWEVERGEVEEGLSIFDTETRFEGEKITKNVEGMALDCKVYGYEIHSGRTSENKNPFVNVKNNTGETANYFDGDMAADKYYGTYLHGIFDSNEFRGKILNEIRKIKNIKEKTSLDLREKREEELNKLEKIVRENIDIEYIYKLLGEQI
ncbi:cobyric acid synthase [Clostridium guangxiense]|uniref:cobyric acid synthase n=1 Tax=Clostridium guangxiense TaxID=1662055 RepID=UPI001E463A72|nr:cobyric acid synthase [Clostridium guangxiense]MCD2348512.1 cobyric acid synthase [Clostridium guangxiense]